MFLFHLTAGLNNNGCPTDCPGQPMLGWDKYKIRQWLWASALICTILHLSALDTALHMSWASDKLGANTPRKNVQSVSV